VALFPSSEWWKDARTSARYTVVICFLVSYTNTSHGVPGSIQLCNPVQVMLKPLQYTPIDHRTTHSNPSGRRWVFVHLRRRDKTPEGHPKDM
jgi:hypothetical protein